MSAFLGPIHYWLYDKIILQQSIVDELYSLGTQYGLGLQKDCDMRYGSFEDRPLEEIIDVSNIHGWLQERVSQVEYKYAYCVTQLITLYPPSFPQIEAILYQKGREIGLDITKTSITLPVIYKKITDLLLDGMPCDHAISPVSQDEKEIIWTRNTCVHEHYWNEVGGDINNYYKLRDAWLTGLADSCGLTFDKIDTVTYRMSLA